jgi:hypothetical protein
MDNDVLTFAQVMAVIVMTVASFVGIGLGARVLWRRGSRALPAATSQLDERLERIEAAVDVIAVEVERISESQRFTVGLLSDRPPARVNERVGDLPSPSVAKRVNTPH